MSDGRSSPNAARSFPVTLMPNLRAAAKIAGMACLPNGDCGAWARAERTAASVLMAKCRLLLGTVLPPGSRVPSSSMNANAASGRFMVPVGHCLSFSHSVAGQDFPDFGLDFPDDGPALAAADGPLPWLDGRSGYFRFTAARTFAFSAGVPFADTRDSAFAPCARSWIG